MMISVWHLLWIVPLSACVGLVATALCVAAAKLPPTPKQGEEK
jgi:hypothetical protein